MSAEVLINKVSVENLPVAEQGMPDLFRVVFRAGTAVARTPSKRANPDGSVEWTQPLEIVVYDKNAKLVAVVQQFNFLRGWVIGPDRHFDGASITALPDEWVHSSDLPTAPRFYAELSVDIEESHHPPLRGIDESDENYRDLPMLCSPRALHYSGGRFKVISPTSVTTTPSTLVTKSVGGGFFRDGSRLGVYSEDSSSASSILSESPRLPVASPTHAPPPYEEIVRERGTLGTAAGALGVPVPLHPEVAVSRSFSWSPLISVARAAEQQGCATEPGDGETCCVARPADIPVAENPTEHPGGEAKPGDEETPFLEKLSRFFSWSPFTPSPVALAKNAVEPPQQRGAHEAAAGAETPSLHSASPRFSPLLPPVSPLSVPDDIPAAKSKGSRGEAARLNAPVNVTNEKHNNLPREQERRPSQRATSMPVPPKVVPKKQDKMEALLARTLLEEESRLGPDHIRVAVALNKLGLHVRDSGRPGEAEDLFRRALEIQGKNADSDDLHTAWTQHELGLCVRKAGRPGEAEEVLKRALQIKEACLGPDDKSVALTLHELGLCVREAGRPKEAKELFERALRIKEAKMGPAHKSVGLTLHEMARSLREAGRPEEAGVVLKRALHIKEASLGADDTAVALTLHELGRCSRAVGLPREAEDMFLQALEIKKARLGREDLEVALTQYELGLCARKQPGRLGEAKEFLRQALPTKKTKLGPGHSQVAVTLREFGRCAREAGRPGEARAHLQQALTIQEDQLVNDEIGIAWTLHELALCTREMGKIMDAEDMFKQALSIKTAKLGPDDLEGAVTLYELGRCARAGRRLVEAEKRFKRALKIVEVNLGPDDIQVAWTLQELGRCVREAGRPGEAQELLKRALRIQEEKLGPTHVSISWTLHDLGKCAEKSDPESRIGDVVKHVEELLKFLQRRMKERRMKECRGTT